MPKPKKKFLKRSFPYRGAVLWNQVIAENFPLTKIPETSIRSFKKLIKDMNRGNFLYIFAKLYPKVVENIQYTAKPLDNNMSSCVV